MKLINKNAFKNRYIQLWLSRVILFISVIMLILSLSCNITHRMPVLSFFCHELKLPYSLKMDGEVLVMKEGEEQIIPVSISIGGYRVDSYSGKEFNIRFTSIEKDRIPVVISYIYQGKETCKVEYINYEDEFYRFWTTTINL